ncbi:MAG: cob(I)yrinic acid a,c-diamide adenosyltransferase [Pirellulales bacterium]
MKIYTKTGDDGETGLFGGGRVAKDDLRIEAYGAVDELNAALGLARASRPPTDVDAVLVAIQNDLFVAGAELATPAASLDKLDKRSDRLADRHIERLEAAIDRFEARLVPLTQFILPGGDSTAAALHLARTICRRAERRVVSLRRDQPSAVSDATMIYINRLGDLLFVLARASAAAAGISEFAWKKELP